MRSPGWKFATSEIGSDLPLRETFISTRGPRRSNGATSAALAGGTPAPSVARSNAPIPIFLMVLAWEARNTPASLSGLGLGFCSENAPRINYSASRKYANHFCDEFFAMQE